MVSIYERERERWGPPRRRYLLVWLVGVEAWPVLVAGSCSHGDLVSRSRTVTCLSVSVSVSSWSVKEKEGLGGDDESDESDGAALPPPDPPDQVSERGGDPPVPDWLQQQQQQHSEPADQHHHTSLAKTLTDQVLGVPHHPLGGGPHQGHGGTGDHFNHWGGGGGDSDPSDDCTWWPVPETHAALHQWQHTLEHSGPHQHQHQHHPYHQEEVLQEDQQTEEEGGGGGGGLHTKDLRGHGLHRPLQPDLGSEESSSVSCSWILLRNVNWRGWSALIPQSVLPGWLLAYISLLPASHE